MQPGAKRKSDVFDLLNGTATKQTSTTPASYVESRRPNETPTIVRPRQTVRSTSRVVDRPVTLNIREKYPSQQKSKEGVVGRDTQISLEGSECVHKIESLITHRVSEQDPGRILLQVKWVSDPEATWEQEEVIQDDASEILFDYWKRRGGREAVLFETGSTPLLPLRKYWVYKILDHKKEQSTFMLKIQWVGYPADEANTTWEKESKLNNCAKELLNGYWASKGGRNEFLVKRRKGNKASTN